MMSDDFDERMMSQSYAIAESMRHEMAWLEMIISARTAQRRAALDPEVKRRLGEYIDILNMACSSAKYLLDHIEAN